MLPGRAACDRQQASPDKPQGAGARAGALAPWAGCGPACCALRSGCGGSAPTFVQQRVLPRVVWHQPLIAAGVDRARLVLRPAGRSGERRVRPAAAACVRGLAWRRGRRGRSGRCRGRRRWRGTAWRRTWCASGGRCAACSAAWTAAVHARRAAAAAAAALAAAGGAVGAQTAAPGPAGHPAGQGPAGAGRGRSGECGPASRLINCAAPAGPWQWLLDRRAAAARLGREHIAPRPLPPTVYPEHPSSDTSPSSTRSAGAWRAGAARIGFCDRVCDSKTGSAGRWPRAPAVACMQRRGAASPPLGGQEGRHGGRGGYRGTKWLSGSRWRSGRQAVHQPPRGEGWQRAAVGRGAGRRLCGSAAACLPVPGGARALTRLRAGTAAPSKPPAPSKPRQLEALIKA